MSHTHTIKIIQRNESVKMPDKARRFPMLGFHFKYLRGVAGLVSEREGRKCVVRASTVVFTCSPKYTGADLY